MQICILLSRKKCVKVQCFRLFLSSLKCLKVEKLAEILSQTANLVLSIYRRNRETTLRQLKHMGSLFFFSLKQS